MRHLPVIQSGRDVIDRIEIPVPCTVSWDGMKGDHAVRHCGECKQNVYNLASFTRAEAVQLLTAHSGRVCLRIYRRPDGTVLTSDCRERLRAARKRGVFVFAGVLLLVLWAQISAQVFGWLSLKRLLGGPFTGEAPAITELAPPDEPIRVGEVAAPPPTLGEPAPVEELMGKPPSPQPSNDDGSEGKKTPKKKKVVKQVEEHRFIAGRLQIRPQQERGDLE